MKIKIINNENFMISNNLKFALIINCTIKFIFIIFYIL